MENVLWIRGCLYASFGEGTSDEWRINIKDYYNMGQYIKECGDCKFYCNGPDEDGHDYCGRTGEPVECYEEVCEEFEE